MENKQKILNMIGLAQKAGKVASGEFSTEKAVKTGKAYTVIVADDSSDNLRKCLQICVLITRFRYIFLVTR